MVNKEVDYFLQNLAACVSLKPFVIMMADASVSFADQGVVGGVTGVFTQPVSGAKKEGVEGFFKGLGKGLIGTVARPVSGMVDFASSSFEGIRK